MLMLEFNAVLQIHGAHVQRHPEVTFPGLLIWPIGGDLLFASIGHVREALQVLVFIETL